MLRVHSNFANKYLWTFTFDHRFSLDVIPLDAPMLVSPESHIIFATCILWFCSIPLWCLLAHGVDFVLQLKCFQQFLSNPFPWLCLDMCIHMLGHGTNALTFFQIKFYCKVNQKVFLWVDACYVLPQCHMYALLNKSYCVFIKCLSFRDDLRDTWFPYDDVNWNTLGVASHMFYLIDDMLLEKLR